MAARPVEPMELEVGMEVDDDDTKPILLLSQRRRKLGRTAQIFLLVCLIIIAAPTIYLTTKILLDTSGKGAYRGTTDDDSSGENFLITFGNALLTCAQQRSHAKAMKP